MRVRVRVRDRDLGQARRRGDRDVREAAHEPRRHEAPLEDELVRVRARVRARVRIRVRVRVRLPSRMTCRCSVGAAASVTFHVCATTAAKRRPSSFTW